jgi:hypothetical protein
MGVDVDKVTGPDVAGILASKDFAKCNEKCNVALCYKKGTATNAATKKKVQEECFCGSDFCKVAGRKYPDEKPLNKLGERRLDTGIRFKVDSIKYVTNDDWHFHCCCTNAGFKYKIAQQEIFDQLVDKTTVRSKATVIVCDMQTKGGKTAGQSSIAGDSTCNGGPGVMLDVSSMKRVEGGYAADTAVHELGHFLGLYHTFNEACSSKQWGMCAPQDTCNPTVNKGDGVDDTPIHIKQGKCNIDASGEPSNSCPGQPGRDPLDNFMSYSGCPQMRFTQGQVARMHSTIQDYFPAFLTKSDGQVAKDLPCNPNFPNKKIPTGYKPPGQTTPAPSPTGQTTPAPSPSGGGGGGGGGIQKCSNLDADQCANDGTGCVCANANFCCPGFGCASWKAGGHATCLPCSWADGGATLLFTTDSCQDR